MIVKPVNQSLFQQRTRPSRLVSQSRTRLMQRQRSKWRPRTPRPTLVSPPSRQSRSNRTRCSPEPTKLRSQKSNYWADRNKPNGNVARTRPNGNRSRRARRLEASTSTYLLWSCLVVNRIVILTRRDVLLKVIRTLQLDQTLQWATKLIPWWWSSKSCTSRTLVRWPRMATLWCTMDKILRVMRSKKYLVTSK